jgi:uncharacterized protein
MENSPTLATTATSRRELLSADTAMGAASSLTGGTLLAPSTVTAAEKSDAAETNALIAKQFLAKIGGPVSAEGVGALFSPDLDWNIPGDTSAMSWVGHKKGREAVIAFVRDTATNVKRIKFEVTEILTSEARAVILGKNQVLFKATGKTVDAPFAIVLTTDGKLITEFLMFEDGVATAQAARA